MLEYPELGMEAIWKIEVEDFPAFIVVDDKGNDFFARRSQAPGHDHQHDGRGCDARSQGDRPEGPDARASTPAQAWPSCAAGNARFVGRRTPTPTRTPPGGTPRPAASGPFAIFFGCADSRVAAEIIFDMGLGDLFVIRTAGHVVDTGVLGSLEFGVGVLDFPLIVILGHDSCGAVAATMDAVRRPASLPGGYIRDIVERVTPSVLTAHRAGLTPADEIEPEHVRPRSGCSSSAPPSSPTGSTADGSRSWERPTTSTRAVPAWSTRRWATWATWARSTAARTPVGAAPSPARPARPTGVRPSRPGGAGTVKGPTTRSWAPSFRRQATRAVATMLPRVALL